MRSDRTLENSLLYELNANVEFPGCYLAIAYDVYFTRTFSEICSVHFMKRMSLVEQEED